MAHRHIRLPGFQIALQTSNETTSNVAEAVPIYTLGYGSRSMDEFMAVLAAQQITYLVDVRSAPYSRYKPEFSKDQLENHLRQNGVRYLYLGDKLGGKPPDPACYEEGKVIYERVRESLRFKEGIERLRRAFEQQLRVVLMCSEGKPSACHRSKLIGVVLAEQNIPVLHIDENGDLRTQDEVILDLTEGQLSLFGEPAFTSRKRYRSRDDDRQSDETGQEDDDE